MLCVADEVNAQAMEVLQGRDEDTERVGKAVILPDEDAVHAARPHVAHKRAIGRILRMVRDGMLQLAPTDAGRQLLLEAGAT